MNVVTIMNYDWTNFNALCMCYTWIQQAKRWLTNEDTCVIFSEKALPALLTDALKKSTTCQFRSCVRPGFHDAVYVPANYNNAKFNSKNIGYKLYVVCQLDFPFVFVDADAFIVGDLTALNSLLMAEKPVFFVDHEASVFHKFKLPANFINSGVFVAGQNSRNLLNWPSLYSFGLKKHFVFRFPGYPLSTIPGSDQSLLTSYCLATGYDYRHEVLTNKYNCGAIFAETPTKVDGDWQTTSNGSSVNILHYWDEKPWHANCPIFYENYNALLTRSFSVESPR